MCPYVANQLHRSEGLKEKGERRKEEGEGTGNDLILTVDTPA